MLYTRRRGGPVGTVDATEVAEEGVVDFRRMAAYYWSTLTIGGRRFRSEILWEGPNQFFRAPGEPWSLTVGHSVTEMPFGSPL